MEILVKHEEIPGLMPAMTMPWKVQTANMLDNLGPGDLITSEIDVDNNQGVITKITKLGTREARRARACRAREAGREISDARRRRAQSGVRRSGRARSAISTAIRGDRAMAVTFIYTKCPIPTFCPAMDRQFAEAQALIKEKGLEAKGRTAVGELRSEKRHAAVLKTHAQKLGADPQVWTFVTGEREAIDRFATSLLLTLVRGEAANPDEIGHTLRTTIVDRDGRIAKSYSGADWTPAELVAELERLL